MVDVSKMAESVFEVVKNYVGKSLTPITERLAALEQRAPERGEKGEPGSPGERGAVGLSGLDGAEGKPGRDGRDGLQGLAGEKGMDGKDGIHGKDGRDGIDGKDGFAAEELKAEMDGPRTIVLSYVRGGERKEFGRISLPYQYYQGVFKDGQSYQQGDTVSFGGAQWHCNHATNERPNQGGDAWTLSVRRGRDGKDGVLTAPKPREPIKI